MGIKVTVTILEDKALGQLADQRVKNGKLTITEAAIEYIMDKRGADNVLFPLPVIEVGNRRAGAGNGRVFIGLFTQEQIAKAVLDHEAGKKNAIKLEGVYKIKQAEKMAMFQTFGRPVNMIATRLTSLANIESEFLARGTKFSTRGRAWEQVVQETLSERGLSIQYIGSLMAGKSDLQQHGDHIVRTSIDPMYW